MKVKKIDIYWYFFFSCTYCLCVIRFLSWITRKLQAPFHTKIAYIFLLFLFQSHRSHKHHIDISSLRPQIVYMAFLSHKTVTSFTWIFSCKYCLCLISLAISGIKVKKLDIMNNTLSRFYSLEKKTISESKNTKHPYPLPY